MIGMQRFVVSYDIHAPAVRRRVARLLSRRGQRVQESVFEVLMPLSALHRMLRALERILEPTDSILAYAISGQAHAIGRIHVPVSTARISIG
jgi:CRISPR-associated endonuclease Cas2